MGTVNLLQIINDIDWKCSVLFVTSDKCYENIEKSSGYKEADKLGGKDIYSSSKAAAELFISSYYRTFLKNKENLSCGRKGGKRNRRGRLGKDRLVVDCMNAWNRKKAVKIRNPFSRPWQHVLEPLSGYLHLASLIHQSKDLNGEPFNFGPNQNDKLNVESLIKKLSKTFNLENPYKIIESNNFPGI